MPPQNIGNKYVEIPYMTAPPPLCPYHVVPSANKAWVNQKCTRGAFDVPQRNIAWVTADFRSGIWCPRRPIARCLCINDVLQCGVVPASVGGGLNQRNKN